MSMRPNFVAYPLVKAAAMTADVISPVTVMSLMTFISYTAVWTGSPVGTIYIEACNDAQFYANGNLISGSGTWVPVYMSVNGSLANSIAVNGAGNALVDIDGISAAYVRFHYAFTSGSGSLSVTGSGKVS